ncbi:MAG: glucose/sorbosone dehydrogenase [Acidobacteria bacterium]|nr:glucose/sorbosone dehydrogenase [Acidobacteriota bacterium]
MFKLLVLLAIILPVEVFAQPKLVPQKVTLKNGKSFNLSLPADFEIVPAAEGLKRIRFFAKAPDGRIFVTDMYNLADNKRGTIYILDGWDAKSGKFSKTVSYLTGLHNPNSVQFYRDADGQDWLYIAETGKLTRRKFKSGEEKPSDANPQTLATFPDYGLSYKYGGWHLTRTIAFGTNGKMYVSVGSSCNSCVEKEEVRASVLEMNPDGSGQRVFAKGLRNAVGLRWFGKFLFATNQGSDHLGLQKPDETFYAVKDGADYGWPYCHSSNGKIFADPKIKQPGGCANVTAPYSFFPARSSALGFDYFDDADSPDLIRGAFLVSLHGSTNKDIGHGYKIVIMRKGEPLQDFVSGFLQNGKVLGRPCDVFKLDANSFLFTDDYSGIVYLVRRSGTTPIIAETVPKSDVTAASNSQPPAPEKSRLCFSLALVCAAFIALVIK